MQRVQQCKEGSLYIFGSYKLVQFSLRGAKTSQKWSKEVKEARISGATGFVSEAQHGERGEEVRTQVGRWMSKCSLENNSEGY